VGTYGSSPMMETTLSYNSRMEQSPGWLRENRYMTSETSRKVRLAFPGVGAACSFDQANHPTRNPKPSHPNPQPSTLNPQPGEQPQHAPRDPPVGAQALTLDTILRLPGRGPKPRVGVRGGGAELPEHGRC